MVHNSGGAKIINSYVQMSVLINILILFGVFNKMIYCMIDGIKFIFCLLIFCLLLNSAKNNFAKNKIIWA